MARWDYCIVSYTKWAGINHGFNVMVYFTNGKPFDAGKCDADDFETNLLDLMRQLGQNRWELVHMETSRKIPSDLPRIHYYFKRPASEDTK